MIRILDENKSLETMQQKSSSSKVFWRGTKRVVLVLAIFSFLGITPQNWLIKPESNATVVIHNEPETNADDEPHLVKADYLLDSLQSILDDGIGQYHEH